MVLISLLHYQVFGEAEDEVLFALVTSGSKHPVQFQDGVLLYLGMGTTQIMKD